MAQGRTKFKLIYIPVGFMIIIGALMIGITDYIIAGFDLSMLATAEFWSNVICTNIGTLCLIISVVMIRSDNFKHDNERYLSIINNIDNFYKNSYVAPLFKKFCYDNNLKTKTIVYKAQVNKKYTKVKPTSNDLIVFYNGTPEQKQSNKYCTKMEYYNRVLSKEYIDRVVPNLSIRYPEISDSIIFTGASNKKQSVDFVTMHKTRKVFIDLLPKYLLSFSLTVLATSIAPDLREGITYAVVFKTIIKTFTIMSQLYFAYNYSNRYNTEVNLHDVMFRETKLNEYNIWYKSKATALETKSLSKEEK